VALVDGLGVNGQGVSSTGKDDKEEGCNNNV
jgi:hypothetical protein